MKSWKTSAAGLGTILTTLGTTLNQLMDGNPATNPDWNLVLPLLFTGCIGLFARDNDKSSEQVGAKPERPPNPLVPAGTNGDRTLH